MRRTGVSAERDVLRAVHLAVGSLPDVRLWRNNVGVARYPGRDRLQHVRYGLCPGSSDLIGILKMPGSDGGGCGCGRFLAIETKSGRGSVEPAQQDFLDLVRRFGGVAAVVRDPEEALAAVARARDGRHG